MPRLTHVTPKARKEVVLIDGYSADMGEFPCIDIYPSDNPDARVSTNPILKIKYHKDGTIKEFEDTNSVYRFRSRPRGRPRRQDF